MEFQKFAFKVPENVFDPDSKPLVSIIIPLYNSEKYIASCIESALHQTWGNTEIIIIDDGSVDNSYDLAKTYESRGNVKIFAQKNSGPCAARNVGFYHSKGDYIQYLDADDLLCHHKIESQLKLLSRFPSGFISSCGWARFDHSHEDAIFIKQDVWKDMPPVDWLIKAWQGGGMMQTACWLTPRNLIEKAGPWDESLRRNPNDDGEFFCRVLLNASGIKFCDEARVFYRLHPAARVSTSNDFDAVRSLLGTCGSYEKNIFSVEKSPRTIKAVATNYSLFMYRFYDSFPELSNEAEKRVAKLGLKTMPSVGGKYFLMLASLIGFKNALRFRAYLRTIRSVIIVK